MPSAEAGEAPSGKILVEAYQLGAAIANEEAGEEPEFPVGNDLTTIAERMRILLERSKSSLNRIDLIGAMFDTVEGFIGKPVIVKSLVEKPKPVERDPSIATSSMGNYEWFFNGIVPTPRNFRGRI